MGPAWFSVSAAGDLRVVVCEDMELTRANAYVTFGHGSSDLLDFTSDSPVLVSAADDVLEAIESQSAAMAIRNIDHLLEDIDYVGIYIEGSADGSEQAWTAGVRAPFVTGEGRWMSPRGEVEAQPC